MTHYVRVYYSIVDDERFAGVFDTPHLATWLRLLMQADAMWPASANIPATERRASVAILAERGLIELLGGGRYRIHGLAAERGRRSESAAIGGRARQRTLSERSANAVPPLSLDEQSRAETRRDEQSTDEQDRRADLDAFLTVRYRPPTPAQRTLMNAYCQVFDETGPERAAQLIYRNPDDPIGALKADLSTFRAERRDAAIKAEEPKTPRRRRGSGLTGVSAELAAMFRAQDEEAGRA